jgi:hypothetical protein
MNDIESKCTIRVMEQFRALGLDKPTLEYEFDAGRKYRADFAFLRQRILVEIEGSQHRTKENFESDIRKYNLAASLGWRLIRLTPAMILTSESVAVLQAAFFPTPNYLDRCTVCLGLNEGIHQECFENLLSEGELDNEQVRKHRRTRKSPLHRAGQIEASY